LYTGFPVWSVDAIEGNGVRTVLIEDVSGFARLYRGFISRRKQTVRQRRTHEPAARRPAQGGPRIPMTDVTRKLTAIVSATCRL
jgi:hypothetical protein